VTTGARIQKTFVKCIAGQIRSRQKSRCCTPSYRRSRHCICYRKDFQNISVCTYIHFRKIYLIHYILNKGSPSGEPFERVKEVPFVILRSVATWDSQSKMLRIRRKIYIILNIWMQDCHTRFCCGARYLPRRQCAFVSYRPLPLAQVAVSAAGGTPIAPTGSQWHGFLTVWKGLTSRSSLLY